MEQVLIATDASYDDVCAITEFALDMEIGTGGQNFTAEFEPRAGVSGGSLLYIDGTEYGGIVDEVESDTRLSTVVCKGRTWDGILAGKVICPPGNLSHLSVQGEANAMLAYMVSYLDVGDVFKASTANSGIQVRYTFARFVDGYGGITGMLASAGAKLKIARVDGKTVLWAEPVRVVSDEVDSDIIDFTVTDVHQTVNHYVCAGEGEGTERAVIHLYADADGNVSRTKTFTGSHEIASYYNYTNADPDELEEEGTKRLQELQTQGAVDVAEVGKGDWDIGDVIEARENRLGVTVSSPVTGKVVRVGSSTNWTLQVDYEVGDTSRGGSSSTDGSVETAKALQVYAADGISGYLAPTVPCIIVDTTDFSIYYDDGQ